MSTLNKKNNIRNTSDNKTIKVSDQFTSTYHHNNLRHELIKTGKKMIQKNGIENFSSRKLAAECGVSYAAPKNHFATKDELINAISQSVGDDFTTYLKRIYNKNKDNPNVLVDLGKGYVNYFIKNPNYYNLFFQNTNQALSINMSSNSTIATGFKPFQFFSEVAAPILRTNNVTEDNINECIIGMWATVHGIAAISTSSFWNYNGDILELTANTLKHYKF